MDGHNPDLDKDPVEIESPLKSQKSNAFRATKSMLWKSDVIFTDEADDSQPRFLEDIQREKFRWRIEYDKNNYLSQTFAVWLF